MTARWRVVKLFQELFLKRAHTGRKGNVVNIRAIAREAGVSISTVSRVLNNAPGVSEVARDAVLTAVNRTGYVPEVGRRSTSNVALVYTAGASLDSPFDAALVNGIYAGLDGSDADLLILDARRSRQPSETLTQMLMRKGAQGALLRTTTASQALCEEVVAEGFAAVVVGSRPDDPKLNCIYSDSRPASREAVEHLLGLGHKRIAIGTHIVEDSDHADRLAGYHDALAAREVTTSEELVIRATADRAGGVQVVRRIAGMTPRPTAVYLTDPLMAVGALEEARRVGIRVPQDLSLIGFDDGELRHSLVPHLTAVCQDTVALGRAASELLLEVIAKTNRTKPKRSARRCWFEIHDSTAPARK
ncbi:MAG: hypothetical protein C0467_11540 [Planctomycetaceae bacterium]|nr:hypothetical protein [Planctomycetaceae bacterium]